MKDREEREQAGEGLKEREQAGEGLKEREQAGEGPGGEGTGG